MSDTKNFNTLVTEDSKDEWLTPKFITDVLGHFDLDPCAPIKPPWKIADYAFNINDDGLKQEWKIPNNNNPRVWHNPPYGRETFAWMAKMANHKSGISLIFARTETKGFHREIWEKADSVFFFEGRLCFYHVDGKKGGTANAPSCLVSYSEEDTAIIEKSGLKGKLVYLK